MTKLTMQRRSSRRRWPGIFVITMTAHVLVMIAFLYEIATGAQGRVLLALGIAVVASGGWVVWLRVNFGEIADDIDQALKAPRHDVG